MNKIFLTALLCVLVHTGFAQLQQGTWATTGNISYLRENQERDAATDAQPKVEAKYERFQLRPSIGFFVSDGFELGITAGYDYSDYVRNSSTQTYATANSYEVKSYTAGVYARKYKFLAANVAVFGQGDINYIVSDVISEFVGSGAFNTYKADYRSDVKHFSVNLRPGVSFFVHDRISLNALYGTLSYSRSDMDHKRFEVIFGHNNSSEYSTDAYDLRFDFSGQSLSLGLSLYFR